MNGKPTRFNVGGVVVEAKKENSNTTPCRYSEWVDYMQQSGE